MFLSHQTVIHYVISFMLVMGKSYDTFHSYLQNIMNSTDDLFLKPPIKGNCKVHHSNSSVPVTQVRTTLLRRTRPIVGQSNVTIS